MIHSVLAKPPRPLAPPQRSALHFIGADYAKFALREIGQRRPSRCKDNTGSLQCLSYAGKCARMRNPAADLKIADRGFDKIGLGAKPHTGRV